MRIIIIIVGCAQGEPGACNFQNMLQKIKVYTHSYTHL